jgi:hypothetical protein
VIKGIQVQLVRKDQKVIKVLRETPELLDQQVQTQQSQVLLDHKELKAIREILVIQVLKEELDQLELLELRVMPLLIQILQQHN